MHAEQLAPWNETAVRNPALAPTLWGLGLSPTLAIGLTD